MTAELEAARDRSDEITVTINRRFAAELLSHADDEISAWPTDTAYVRDLQDFIAQINKAMIETRAAPSLAAAMAVPEVKELVAVMRKMYEGWSNALELAIIHERHRTAAGILRDDARAILAKLGATK